MVKAGHRQEPHLPTSRRCTYFPTLIPRLMNRNFRPTSLAWLALVAGAVALLVIMTTRRIARIEQMSDQAPVATVDSASPTGYTHGTRGLLLPVGSYTSQPWIMDVQKMTAAGSWNATVANYDNAPEGRPVHGPSPYRWWLRLVAGAETQSGGQAVERAALHADPALHLLLCAGAGLFVAWRFGAVAGGLLALGIVVLFSHAQVFSPGQPDDHGLFLTTNLIGLLLLLAGWQTSGQRAARLWLGAAGAAGGFGLWLDAGSQLAVLAALFVGGIAASWSMRKTPSNPLPWRSWATGGAIVAIVGWLIEGRPGGLAGLNLDSNHPLLVLTWFGAAEILVRLHGRSWSEINRTRRIALAAGLVVLLAPLGWLFFRGGANSPFFGPDHPALAGHGGLLGWLKSSGLSLGLIAALLPVLLIPAAWHLKKAASALRPLLVFTLASAIVLLLLGGWQLRWWALLDVMLLGLLTIVAAATPGGFTGIAWRSGLGLVLLPGLIAAWPRHSPEQALAPVEARALVERDLAQWLAARSERGTIAFAPPELSASLCYYGGLRVVASPYPGNRDGLALATRIAGTVSTDEAQALLQQRGIQYIVVPSWDDTLDHMAKLAAENPERSLVALLRQWLPPRWLRPVAYQMPVIPGLERDSLAVFEVVEPQENALALSRLAEYFAEIGQLDLAAAVGDTLEKSFAADAGAMVARAKVAIARREARTLARIMPELLPAIADGGDEDLPWERRANLALVLALTKHPDLARQQVEFCFEEADLDRLRSLGPVSLFRLLALGRSMQVEFADTSLHAAAMNLLPAEFQAQLRQ